MIFNFRSDRVVELSKALEYDDFTAFDRYDSQSSQNVACAHTAYLGLTLANIQHFQTEAISVLA